VNLYLLLITIHIYSSRRIHLNMSRYMHVIYSLSLCFAITTYGIPVEETSSEPIVPTSEWGSYYTLENPVFANFFADALIRFQLADALNDDSLSYCIRQPSAAGYSRYYKNTVTPNKYILSYFCKAGPSPDRGYEHIVVTADREGDEFTNIIFVEFASKLSALGVSGAGDYGAVSDAEESEAKIEELFAANRVAIEENLPTGCTNPNTAGTEFRVHEKFENELTYWRFPVACTVETENDMYTEVEVFKDTQNRYVNDGNYGLAAISIMTSNAVYHKIQDTRAESALQSNAAVLSSIISLIMVSIAALL
jgi:hypothetical protein